MPAPEARVHVEELEPSVARVTLELELDEPGVAKPPQQPTRRIDDLGAVDGLHVRAGASELRRVLACPPRRQPGERLAIQAKRRERELALAAAGDELLNHQGFWRNQRARLGVPFDKLLVAVDAPCLRRRQPVDD